MGLILDSSVLFAAEKGKFDLVGFLDSAAATQTIHLAAITASELWHGVERADTAERREKRLRYVQRVLDELPVIPFGSQEARTHARIWAELVKKGKMIGAYDMLIAATAISADHHLITLNTHEFQRVTELKLMDVIKYHKAD